MKRLVAAMVLGLLVSACGGFQQVLPSDIPPRPPRPIPAPPRLDEEDQVELSPASTAAARALKTQFVDGNSRWRVLDALWTHREDGRARPAHAGAAPRR